MKLIRILTLLLYILLTGTAAHAQTGKLFTADRELSSSMVNQVYQDRDGVIWIATENGLNRYDGARFTLFRHEPGNPESLSNNYVNNVFEDSRGNLFVSTMCGLNIMDRARGTFRNIKLHASGYTLDNANVQMVLERRNGQLLVAVNGYSGIYTLICKGDSISSKPFPLKLKDRYVNLLFEDSRGGLWLSATDSGLFRFTAKDFVPVVGLPQGATVLSMCEDRQGRLYAGCATGGLFVQEWPGGRFRNVDYALNPGLSVRALRTMPGGKILIGTDGHGLKQCDTATGTISNVPMNTPDMGSDLMKIHSILLDSSGGLWLGIYQKGVLLLPTVVNGFMLTGWRSATCRLGSSACIMSVMRTRGGTTLIGTDGDGLYAVSPAGTVSHFAPTAAATSVPAIITAVFEDSRGTLWLGSYMQGMASFDLATGHCRYVHALRDEDGRPVKSVYSFAEDRHARLWIGSNGSGLFSLDTATGRITPWSKLPGKDNALYNRWVNKVLIAGDGKIYVGAFGGMSVLDPVRRSWVSTFGTTRLLPNAVVYTLAEDRRHNIWAGTDAGLVCLNPRNGVTKRFTISDGLPENLIMAILPDRRGDLWLSTSHGLSRLNTRTMRFMNFFADDGLQGNEFSRNAAFADSELFFGGTNGVTHFRPDAIKPPKRIPQIHIAGIYINDQEVTAGMKSGFWNITDREVMKSSSFQLAHNDNSFRIEFTAREFYNPARISYSYSINDGPWTTLAQGVNSLSFSRLASGSYHFKVRSCDYGVYSSPLEFTVVIHPAWWASLPAYIIYVLLVAAAAWFAYRQLRRRYMMKQEMQKHIYAEQVKEAKLQFFINVSHDIRTPMQLVISPLQKLIATDKDKGRQHQYSIVMHNAQRILRLINQLMDIRKLDKGMMRLTFRRTDMASFVTDVCSTFSFQMQRRGIKFNLLLPDEGLTAWVDPENFDKILVNLLSNALKFTPQGGTITVALKAVKDGKTHVKTDNGSFELSVSDTGIGIEPSKMNCIFERFYQIDNNITTHTAGTGVGLNLVRQLVTLHHGTISVRNNTPGAGCTFTVSIPIGRSHLKDSEIEEGETVTHANRNVFSGFEDTPELQPEESKATKARTRFRILLAEDDEGIRDYVTDELSADFHITACTDGQEAWDKIRRDSYDLLISDIMMPRMDGLTLCRKVKQNIHTNTVPVILLTAKVLEEEQIAGLEHGADAYITKPFSIEYLKSAANSLLRNRTMLRTSFEGKQEQQVDVSAMQEEGPNDKLMRRIMKVINDNISDPYLNIDKISREVGISRVHLYRKLKELTNQSARDFLRNVRLKHAAELLRQGNSNVSRIAELTGFSSVAVFSHAFKELYGVSPTEFAGDKGSFSGNEMQD